TVSSPESVGAVHATGDLARGKEPGGVGGGGVGVHPYPTHHVVTGRADLHGFGGDVHVGQFPELVVHGRQPFADLLGGQACGHVEEHTAVPGSASFLDLAVDGSGHLVTGQEF